MASKDDDFDFKWDDDGSFDSELDKFGGDVDEYRPDEVKDAEKDRNPVTSKLKSIAPTIRDAGSAVLAGAGVQIGKSIEKNVPEVYQTYNNATYVLSEAETLRNQVVDKVKPWWNDTKRVLRKLSQQLDGQMPFGLDKKILKLIGEEEQDQQYKQPSKEDMRREQMDSNINHIFELQMQKSMEQQKDTILNRTIDRRIANIHHKESASFLAKIAENSVFQHAFTSSVFTAYLKKDLELKYKHFYVSEDILEVFKNHAKAVDTKLDAVIKNTALPEADKIHMSERVIGGMKTKLADTFNDKLQNYFGKVREKVLRHVNDALDIGKTFTDIIGSQVDMLEIMNDPEMAAMGGMGSEPSVFTKKGLMHLLLGNVGGFFAKRALKPLWNKVPQETQELLRQYFRKGRNGIALLMDDLRSGRIKGVPDELRDLLQALTPKLNENLDKGFVLNEGFQTLDQGAKFTTKFVKTVEDIIPGYLAMQTRYLEMMATNKDSGIQRWNFKTMSFENEKDRMARVRKMVDVSDSTGKDRLQKSVIETRKMIEHKADRYGVVGSLIAERVKKSLQEYYPEIELFIVNLAYSDRYYQVKPKEFIEELDAIVKTESLQDLAKIPLYKEGFQDIENVKQVAGFWLDMLSDRSKNGETGSMPDKAAIVSFNNRLLDERAEVTRSYTKMLEDELKQGNFEAIKAFGGKIGPDGRVVLDLRTLRRNEFKTTSHINIKQDLSAEQIKNYNDTFAFNELEKETDKNVLLEKFKNFLGNLKKIDPREMTDDLGKPIFSWFYRKLKGENKEKELEEAWNKVLHGVDVTKDFLTNTYNEAASAIEKWYKQLGIRTVYELLDMIATTDSGNSTAWHLLRDKLIIEGDDGKKELRSLADLDASEWYDWFSHLSDAASAAAQFNNGDAKSNLLLSLFPDDIKALIFAICNDPELTKKMKLVNQQFNGRDPATVERRQAELKKLATAAIEDTKRKIADRSTAYSTMNNAKYDALTADIARIAKNNKELREREMSQISTEGFNGTEEHNYIKQQLDVLKSIDTQLSEFYYAFVDSKRKEAERKRIRKTYDKVSDGLTGKKYEQNDEIDKATTADEKMVVAYDKLNELYDRYGAAKRKGDKTGVDKANKAIRDILRKFYGDEVQLSNLETYVNKFSDENTAKYRELKRIRSTTFNPYTGQVEELTDEEAKKYKNVAERDAALIDEIIAAADKSKHTGLKMSDTQKAHMRVEEQQKLYAKRARVHYLKLLVEMPDNILIKQIPNANSVSQIAETAKTIRDIIKNNQRELLDDINFHIPLKLVYGILATQWQEMHDEKLIAKRKWLAAVKRLLSSRLDNLGKMRTITPLEYMGIFIQPADDVNQLLWQMQEDAAAAIRSDITSFNKSMARYDYKDKSEQDIRKSLGIDFDDLIGLASAKSLNDYTDINKQLSKKYNRDIAIDDNNLLAALSRIYDYRNAESNRNTNRRSDTNYSNKINNIKTVLNNFDISKFSKSSADDLNALSQRYTGDLEFRHTSDIIESIRDNFSTHEDINENGVGALRDMLGALLEHFDFAENTTIEDLFEAITGKDYYSTVFGTKANQIQSAIVNLQQLRRPEVLALPNYNRDPVISRMIHNEDYNLLDLMTRDAKEYAYFNDLATKNKKIESATSNSQSGILALPAPNHSRRDPVMSRMIHNEDMHFNDLIARNKIKIESATSNPQSEILALPYIPHEKYAKGGNFDAEAEVQNYQNMYDKIARTAYGRYKDKAGNSLIEAMLAGKDYAAVTDLEDGMPWDVDNGELQHAIDNAKWCDKLEYLLQKAPILDKTDYYRQWLNIPSTVHVAAIHLNEDVIKKHCPNLDADFWETLTDVKNYFNTMSSVKDPRYKNSGYIIRRLTGPDKKYKAIELFNISHELGHIVTERGTIYGVGGNRAHHGRGHYTEKHADIYGLKRYLTDVGPADIHHITNWLAWSASSSQGDDFAKSKSNGSDGRWRADLMRRYMRMRKYKGDPLYANLNDEFLKPQYRDNYAKGDNISLSLPIDRIGGYVDQPTEILGGSGIAGEAGGETIIPHKYNERFKELIYRCLRDTVGENMARKVLRMMKPSDTTKEKLGINLPDTGYGMLFAKGGDLSGKLSRDEIKKRIESIDATLADHEENSNYRLDYIEQIRKEKADLENQLKVEDMSKQKEEYTRQHPTDTIKGILLNIMESNEAIYRKMGDGLLVVDLAAMLDKLKDTKILDKLKSLKIGEKIKNFVFGAYDKGKGFAGRVYDFGKNVTKTVASNIGSFGRHMFTNKVCDVYLKSKIEGQVHGDLKIKSSELEHGTIFADPECTKPIYSVADIYPPVYRKVDKNGTETVEEAIREDEGKDGLVDVEGHSLVRFGGKVGRFLHHVAATPLKAILTHKNWERLKGLGTSIASGIGSGINGLLDAYCDVYSKLDNAKEMLVSGTAIKEGRLVRIPKEGGEPKVVPTVFDIDGECWLMIDDPDNPGKRKLGNQVIKDDHLKAGLCHKDGSPIESSKIAKATSMLRRAAGAIGNGLLSLTGGVFDIGANVISWAWDKGKTAAKWVKDRVKDAFTAKNPYIDVCVIRDNEKKVVMHADELRTNKATHRYCFMDKDGKMTPVLSAYGIDAPVFDMRGSKIKDTDAYDHKPVEIITKDDVDNQAIYDTEGNRLTKWAGRSLAGKIGAAALGSVKFGWKAIKGLGKGLWNVGKTVLGGIGSLLGEGGAAVTSFFTKAWSSTLDFFKNSVISRKDLKELVGDRLLDIYGLLYKYMPRKKYDPNDKDGDGDVDGSWADYEQRRKDREAKREQDRLNQWYKDHPNAARGDDSSFMSKLKEAFLSGFGGGGASGGILSDLMAYFGANKFWDWITGKGAGTAAGAGAAAGAGKAGLLKRLFSPITNLFATPNSNNGMRGGKLYNLRKKVAEFFVGNNETLDSGKFKRGILNVLRGYGLKAKNAAKDKAASGWNWFKGLFGNKAAAAGASRAAPLALPYYPSASVAAGASRAAPLALPYYPSASVASSVSGAVGARGGTALLALPAPGKATALTAAEKAAAKGFLGRIGARLAAAGAANAAPPIIGQIISAGMLLWTAYDVVKYFATDNPKVKGLRPIRLKAYGVDVKYWEAIEDLETDTFSEFKSGNSEGVDVDRLKKFGYKIDFLDASEMAYGGDKLEYIRTWYKLKFVPFYQKYVQSLILACKLDPKEQPKGDDIPDQLYPTIVLELTQGFKKVNVGPLKDLNLNKASYEKWLARKREKEREEGLSAGKYSNKDLAEKNASNLVTEKFGNVSDHLAYAWNEIKHGNLINASVAMYKAYGTAIAKIGAAAVDLVGKLYPVGLTQGLVAAFTGETSKNEKAWDEIRMKLYGLDKTTTNAKEYERIVSLIKDFEVRQLHVIDGEEQMVEDDLRELAEEIFTEKVRSKIKFRLNSSGIPIIDTSKDLGSESRSFVISWYKRIFLPIFGLYANMVRMSYGDGPGDNIVIDNVPEDQRAELLKEYEREAKKMLDKNIDTEILRLSPEGFYDYLIMRSEEDIAELSKDSEGMVREDDLSYGDKLSRSLDDAGNDLSKAWALKFKNPGKALGLAAKGIGKAAWGVVKTTVTSITSSIVDLLVGSANEHRWETRFIDYGFTRREGSSDYFKNDNLRSMEEFENEAGKQLLEDNTGKPDEEYFVKIALNSGFIENCCQKIFNSGSGIDGLSLAATNMGNIFSLWNPGTWGLAAAERVMNRSFGIRSLSELKEKLVDYLVSNAKDNADLEKTELSIKTKVADMINYLDFWWTIRFKPVFDAFISVVTAYGVEPDDIDVDDIPQESRDEAFEAYKKASAIALKKDRAAMYTLSAEGCALYLEKVEEYREDAKDGTIDNSGNPLAKFYKEKEQQFEDNVVAAVVANAGGLDKVEKARVAKALSKASVEIDSELNDVNAMAKYAAKDILEQLNVKDLLNKNHTPKESIYGILMKLTMGENHYDKIAKGSGWIFDDSLGKLFTKFVENAHECLYGTDADKLADYLKEFSESCLQSDLFIFNTPKGGKVKFENAKRLNEWIDAAYPNLGGGDHTANYFGTWFAYRFMPYYAYFVTLVNKANDKQDLKEKPDVDDLTVMRRNYVIDKLVKSENKGLISGKAKAMKIDANSFYKFFEKLNETEGNYKALRAEIRSNGRKALEEQIKDAERQLAEDRAKRKASNKSKEDIERDVEEKDLANVDAVSTVKPGTRVGDNKAKRKGRSCTDAERQYIYNFLTSELGLTPEQAAAVMGNMMQESSMSPDVINSIGATGLFQWLGYRVNGGRGYKGLIPFAKENGLDPYSVEAQMKYLKWELENVPYEKNRFDKYVRSIVTDPKNPSKTVAQCAVGFRVGFERCGEHEAQDSKRVGYAKEFYRKFGPGTMPEHLFNTAALDTAPNDSTGTTGAVTTKQPSQVPDNRNEQADDAASRALLPQYRYKDVQDNVGTTPTNTSSPNITSSVGVSGSKQQPTYLGSYGNMSDQTRKACDYVTKHSHAHSLGKCARYVANALQAAGYKFNRQPSAYMYHTNGILTKMGFTCIGSANARPQAGDICVINRFQGHPHGHICMYNGRQWISDFRQRTASPYLAGAPGGIWYYRPNGSAASSTATSNVVANVNNEMTKKDEEAYTNAVNNVRNNSPAEPVRHASASVISNTSTEGTNDSIRTLSAMQTDITNANSGNAPVISELKVISSILAAFKGDVSGFIKLITTNAGLTKTNTANKSTAEIATDKNISDEKLNILIDKLNELAQLISTSGNPSTAKVPQKYHVRDNYMQGYPLQANKVNS